MNETKFTIQDDNKTLVVERVFYAPRSKVWAAWTTPELFVKWWGPNGWETTVKHMDFKEGGYLLYGMKCEDPEQTECTANIVGESQPIGTSMLKIGLTIQTNSQMRTV